MRRTLAKLAPLLLVAMVACKSEPSASTNAAPATSAKGPKPIPTDLVFNDFIVPEAGPPPVTPPVTPSSTPAGDASVESGSNPGNVKVTAPGAEPRTKLRYAFKQGRAETVVVTIKSSVTQQMTGAPAQGGEQPPVTVTLLVTPKRVEAGQASLELKLQKLDVPKGPEEARLRALSQAVEGAPGNVAVSDRGVLSELAFGGGAKLAEATQELLSLVQQALEIAVIPLPEDPVGVGGTWEFSGADTQGPKGTINMKFTLVEGTRDLFTVKVDSKRAVPVQQVRNPRAPPGMTVEMHAEGSYTLKLRFDGLARSGTGEALSTIVQTDTLGKPPHSMTTRVKINQTLENKTK